MAVGLIDFKSEDFSTITFKNKKILKEDHFFDLASLTKPLTMGAYDLKANLKDENLLSLLEHRSSLPPWGRLSHEGWKEQILSYEINPTETVYSDFGALRFMLEIEKKEGSSFIDLCSDFWNDELVFWKNLKTDVKCVPTGIRNGKTICGEVHDDNCFVINEFCTHAGLFSTPDALAKSLLNLNQKHGLIKKMSQHFKGSHSRFLKGWDTKSLEGQSLAGSKCSDKTFGHLGFTGNSMWIDCEKDLGFFMLSNQTFGAWTNRSNLNDLRRSLADEFWSKNFEKITL